jgi:hypothetical protein
MGQITEAEALAAVQTGAIPAAFVPVIDALPTEDAFAARMLLTGATVFERNHPMTAAFAAGLGWTEAQIDGLWVAASAL